MFIPCYKEISLFPLNPKQILKIVVLLFNRPAHPSVFFILQAYSESC